MPMLADARPAAAPRLDAVPLDRSAASGSSGSSLGQRIADSWRYFTAETWQQFQQLIRVRQVNQPDALMLAPSQAYFVRENLKLRLLNARLALLARQEAIYRSDLLRVEETLQTYFDTHAQSTVAAQALLQQLQSSTTSIELPTLSDSLNAVRNFKSAGDHS
jgi:uroporphyrin-3 C-methyltransferase/uroporphyrinogen III methyltransferase/synthase